MRKYHIGRCLGLVLGLVFSLAILGSAPADDPLPSTWGPIPRTKTTMTITNNGSAPIVVNRIDSGGKEVLLTKLQQNPRYPQSNVDTHTFDAFVTDQYVVRLAGGDVQRFTVAKGDNNLILGDPKPFYSLIIRQNAQQTNMWCWAASGEMAMNYLGLDVPQCVQAAKRYNLDPMACCRNPVPNNAIQGGYPEFGKYGVTFQTTTSGRPLAFIDLKREICNGGRPVPFEWLWAGGGGHIMVAIGYWDDGASSQLVIFNDPAPPSLDKSQGGSLKYIPYEDWVSVANQWTHGIDYYQLAVAPPSTPR